MNSLRKTSLRTRNTRAALKIEPKAGRYTPRAVPVPSEDVLQEDPRWALVQRVADSPAFGRSRRLRDFLRFAGERAVRDPQTPLSEHEIRRHVFGRTSDADATEDTLVRVHASHLRRRLEHYFAVEGASEPMVIEVPLGSYLPIFRARPGVATPVPPEPVAVDRAPLAARTPVLAAVIVLLAAACIWFFMDARRWRLRAQGVRATPVLGSSVDRLWRQMFGGARVYVVVADSNLTLLQDAANYQLSLPEYQRQQFATVYQQRFPEAHKPWGWRLMNREFTSVADTLLAQRVAAVRGAQGRPTDVVMARRADPSQFGSSDVILSGPRRANPWLELFEGRLNFQSRFEEKTRRAHFENVKPAAGEESHYAVQWNETGYCRIAYLPNLSRTGNVLLISGLDMSSSDAGSEFVTSERRVEQLLSALGIGPSEKIPHFEVLLRTKVLIGTTSDAEIVTHRRR